MQKKILPTGTITLPIPMHKDLKPDTLSLHGRFDAGGVPGGHWPMSLSYRPGLPTLLIIVFLNSKAFFVSQSRKAPEIFIKLHLQHF
jgi:hypothetical protein